MSDTLNPAELPPLPNRTALSITTPDAMRMVQVLWDAKQYSSQKEALYTGEQMEGYARVAIAADRAQLAQQGHGEPTTDMIRAGMRHFHAERDPATKAYQCYKDMLAASPATVTEAAAPAGMTPLDYRAQGREEAMAIILEQDPENPFADHTNSVFGGEDYSTEWDEAALRELLHIGDSKHDAYDRAEAAYWDALGHKKEVERMRRMVERAPFFKPLSDFLAEKQEWGLLHQLQDAAAPDAQQAAPTEPVDEKWAIYYDNLGKQPYESGFMQPWKLYDSERDALEFEHITAPEHYKPRKVFIYAAPATAGMVGQDAKDAAEQVEKGGA